MLKHQDLFQKLSEIYSIKCPSCGAQWTFEIGAFGKYKEVRTCDCEAYYNLITKRTNSIFGIDDNPNDSAKPYRFK